MYTGRIEEERASSNHLRPDTVLSGITEEREGEVKEEDVWELEEERVDQDVEEEDVGEEPEDEDVEEEPEDEDVEEEPEEDVEEEPENEDV